MDGDPEARLYGEWGKLSTREGGSRRAGDREGEGAISPPPQVLSPGEEEGRGKPGLPGSPAAPLHA